MTVWVYWPSQVAPGQAAATLVLETEVAKPEYDGMDDDAVAAAISVQSEPDPTPVEMALVRRTAIENRVWGKLDAFSARAFGTGATQDLTNACRNFMSLFRELGGECVLVRGNDLWSAMDADLTLMTSAAGGGPVLTTGQANWMRALGDRTRQKWQNGVQATDVGAVRQPPA